MLRAQMWTNPHKLCHSFTISLWACHSHFLGLSFSICEMGRLSVRFCFYLTFCKRIKNEDFHGSPAAKTLLTMQGPGVRSLVRELDPTCCN